MKTLKEALFSRRNISSNPFGLTKDDMIGQLKGFPVGVVVRMLEEQEKQYGDTDIKEFQEERDGGFVWNDSVKGYDFWSAVIIGMNFDLFFEEYPEYARYNLA